MGEHLLDDWAERLGVLISDLRNPSYRDKLLEAAQETACGKYPVEVWNEALNYLWGVDSVFSSAQEAKAYILQKGQGG